MSEYYEAFGLKIKSEFHLSGLSRCMAHENDYDVLIRYGDVPDVLPDFIAKGSAWYSAPNQLLINVHNICKYLILNGNEIIIHPFEQTTDQEIRAFLLGSSFGGLLHQRKILPLHASGIKTKLGAVLFMGRTGAGKSTLLAALLKRGYEMITDDIAAVVFNEEGKPIVSPAFPVKRLAEDATEKLDIEGSELQLGRGFPNKYHVQAKGFADSPLELYRVYDLNLHNSPDIKKEEVLSKIKKFEIFMRHTYRKKFTYGFNLYQTVFKKVTSITGSIPITQITRPVDRCSLNQLADIIEEDMGK